MKLDTLKDMASKYTKPILLLATIAIIVVFLILSINEIKYDCQYRHTSSYNDLLNKMILNNNGTFSDTNGKLMAQTIYTYRSQFAYDYSDSNNYINIFDIHKPSTPYGIDALSDVALYKLATCDISEFSKMVMFTYVFNNDKYNQCIAAYDTNSKKFKKIESEKSTRDIIIKDILKFGDSSISDLKKSIKARINTIGMDPSITDSLINAVIDSLNNMSDEGLYNLISIGLVE